MIKMHVFKIAITLLFVVYPKLSASARDECKDNSPDIDIDVVYKHYINTLIPYVEDLRNFKKKHTTDSVRKIFDSMPRLKQQDTGNGHVAYIHEDFNAVHFGVNGARNPRTLGQKEIKEILGKLQAYMNVLRNDIFVFQDTPKGKEIKETLEKNRDCYLRNYHKVKENSKEYLKNCID
jgi:hypothetical protein